MSKQSSVRWIGYGVMLLVLALLFELVAYVAVRFVVMPRAPYLLYDPPAITETDFQAYLAKRDPRLGWPAPKGDGDGIEPRPAPALAERADSCVSLYGDSYVYGDEVADGETFGNALSERLGCRVANYGIGGYGTDQSLLRFRHNQDDDAQVAILGIFPYNLMRNVNQYRYYITGVERLSFKPRFVLAADGGLKLIELPQLDFAQAQAELQQPGQQLHQEFFLPDTESGPATVGFPYSLSLLRAAFSERVANWLQGRPSWSGFFDPAHGSQALPLTQAIVRDFMALAEQRGKRGLVLLLPTNSSFEYYRAEGRTVTDSLRDGLQAEGIAHLDLTRALDARLGPERSFCELLTDPASCYGHYSPSGNRMVGEILAQHLRDAGLR